MRFLFGLMGCKLYQGYGLTSNAQGGIGVFDFRKGILQIASWV